MFVTCNYIQFYRDNENSELKHLFSSRKKIVRLQGREIFQGESILLAMEYQSLESIVYPTEKKYLFVLA